MPNDGNKNMYEERLLSSLNELGSVEGSGKNFDDVRIELIKKDSNEWRDRSFKSKMRQVGKGLHRLKNKKIFPQWK